jgi:large subunit ribosomal protein L1
MSKTSTSKQAKNSKNTVKAKNTELQNKTVHANKGLGRSKKWKLNLQKIDKALAGRESLALEEAVALLFSLENPNFKDGVSVEIHAKLGIDSTKSDQLVRSNVVLPHGNGKKVKIAAFVNPENVDLATKLGCYKAGSDELIEEIKTTQKIDFDIAIAQPEMMKKLPVIARTLGTAGVMPNPKNGTVSDNIEALVKEFMGGRVNFKNDKSGNVHFLVGRINPSFDQAKIVENLKAAIEAIEKAKPDVIKKKYLRSIHIATTMSPSIQISL